MDHRCGIRHQMGLLARLHISGRAPLLARARDASLGGVFVETGSLRLPLRTLVEIELLPPGDAPSVRVQAMVVRKNEEGVGLMFDDFAPRELSSLLGHARFGRQRIPAPHPREPAVASLGRRQATRRALGRAN